MTTQIEVHVKFLSPKEGGRKILPVLRGYRPHFIVPPNKEMLGVEFTYGPIGYQPDEEIKARVICLYEELGISYEALIVGVFFEIVEGRKVVGTGTVVAYNKG